MTGTLSHDEQDPLTACPPKADVSSVFDQTAKLAG